MRKLESFHSQSAGQSAQTFRENLSQVRRDALPTTPEESSDSRGSSGASVNARGPGATSSGNMIRRQMLQILQSSSFQGNSAVSAGSNAPTPNAPGDPQPIPLAPALLRQRPLPRPDATTPGAYSCGPGQQPIRADKLDRMTLNANANANVNTDTDTDTNVLPTTERPPAVGSPVEHASADGPPLVADVHVVVLSVDDETFSLPRATPINPRPDDVSHPA